MFSLCMDENEKLLSDLRVEMQELRGDVRAILVQVTATNGRVTKSELEAQALRIRIESIETFKKESMDMLRGAFWVVTSIVTAGSVIWTVAQAVMSVVGKQH